MNDWIFQGDYAANPVDYRIGLLSLLLAFACGHVMAWLYIGTHTGLSYSRSFVNSLIVMPVIVALVLMILSNSLVTAFGLMAVLAIVRFRNVLRDTLDTTYVLGVIVLGMACGTQRFTTAVLGCALLTGIIVYLWFTSFGTRQRYGMVLNLHWAPRTIADMSDLAKVLGRHSRKVHRTNQRSREGGEGTDLSYRILLRNPDRADELLAELRALEGVSAVTALGAEEESEL